MRIDTRCVLVEGGPAPLRTGLAQRLALQLSAVGVAHELRYAETRGHPLRRPWDPVAYADGAAFLDALVLQWENFAVRAAQGEAVPWVLDGALLRAPQDLLVAGTLDRETAEIAAERLVEALEPLQPTLLYVWQEGADAGDDRTLMDGVFGRLEISRLLLNAHRADEETLLDDALGLLGVARREVALAPELHDALSGRYGLGDGGGSLEVRREARELVVEGLPSPAPATPCSLLPTIDGALLVAGVDLELRPSLDATGRALGLLARSDDPRLDGLPEFLARTA